jgi:hypothetical protein
MRINIKHWIFWAAMIVALSFALMMLTSHRGPDGDRWFAFIVLFDVIGLTIWYVRRLLK